MKVKDMVDRYRKEEEGDNPIYAAFHLITFAKAIPWHLGKAILLALLLYLLLTFAMFKLGVGYILLLFGFIVGFVWAILIGITAGVKFITSSLINNFTELLTGVVEPVDEMYDHWKANSATAVSRSAFFRDVAKEVLVPEFTKMIRFLPFKGRIEKYLQQFLNRVFNDKDRDAVASSKISIQQNEAGKGFVTSVVDSIEEGTEHIQSKISSPFRKTLQFGLLFWGGLFLLDYLLKM